ncbi:retrotransposon protein [Hordeum vulgare]|nr:retrotransposon protein [Hordeum vulgare]
MSLVPYDRGAGGSLAMHCPVLTGKNYTVWAIKVEANHDVVGLWEAVMPAEDSAPAVMAKKDKSARVYRLGALSEEILLQASAKKTTAELWSSLRTRYVGANRVRAALLATLRGDCERLHMSEAEMLDAFAGREQWAARRRQKDGGGYHDDDGRSNTTSGRSRGRCYNCGQRGDFKLDFPKPRKAPEEQAMLVDAGDAFDGQGIL